MSGFGQPPGGGGQPPGGGFGQPPGGGGFGQPTEGGQPDGSVASEGGGLGQPPAGAQPAGSPPAGGGFGPPPGGGQPPGGGGFGPPPGGQPPGGGGFGPPPGGQPPGGGGFGQPPSGAQAPGGGIVGPGGQKTNTLAIVSAALGLPGLFSCCCCSILGIPLPIAAIVCGVIALKQIKEDPEGQKGKELAYVGIGLGAFLILSSIVLFIFNLVNNGGIIPNLEQYQQF